MNEKWTYLILSDPEKEPTGIRMTLQDRDSGRQASMQLTADGNQVEVTDEAHDYEAMEWKVKEIVGQARADGDGATLVDAAKDHLRTALAP
ncbi:MAG: hypothetical protein U5R31_13570 [Acidimicrobiia bacterium]|nr:hypothetical protein [Acidimicrobiia bacterium]